MRHPLSDRFHELLKEIGELHDKKQADYGREGDPFANVRGSEEWGIEGWVGAMVRLNDKLRRLQAYAKKGTLENEGVEDSFKDMAVYALIALCLWEEEHRSKNGVRMMHSKFPPEPRTDPQAAPIEKITECRYPWVHAANCDCDHTTQYFER